MNLKQRNLTFRSCRLDSQLRLARKSIISLIFFLLNHNFVNLSAKHILSDLEYCLGQHNFDQDSPENFRLLRLSHSGYATTAEQLTTNLSQDWSLIYLFELVSLNYKDIFHIFSQHVTRISDINRCFLFVSS